MPGLVHGFEQRTPGSPAETREESRSRVSAAFAGAGSALLLKQVHGATVVEAPWDGSPRPTPRLHGGGLLLAIETADCLPILLVDPQRRLVAAAHAGWRGTAAEVAGRTVDALVARGSRPDDLLAALGPGIGPCCYEVGDGAARGLRREARPSSAGRGNGRLHLDLRTANARQLLARGRRPEVHRPRRRVHLCRADLYHSERRRAGE